MTDYRPLRRRAAVTRFGIRLALLPVLLAAACMLAHAQEDSLRPRYGVLGGYNVSTHRADFRALPGVPNCCPRFESGTGGGAILGALAEFPLSANLLLSIRGSYISHNAVLKENEPVTVVVAGTREDGALTHTVDARIASIGLEPGIGVRIGGGAIVSLGVRAGAYLTKSYSQQEQTDVGTFLDAAGADTRSRVRNASAGELPNAASLLVQAAGGIGYELPLNGARTLLLVPEVTYALSLTDVVSGVTWKPDGLRAVIAIKYSPKPEPAKPERYDTVYVRDTTTRESGAVRAERITLVGSSADAARLEDAASITVRTTIREHYLRELPAPPPMTCALRAVGVNDDGAVQPIATLRLEEFLSTVAHPLLNYVFFEPGSAEIPGRYTMLARGGAASFHARDLHGATTLAVYHTLLNIIGERMRENPAAVLTLTGCNMDQAEEKGNLELSRRRAVAVRDYLAGVWGLDTARLRIEAANLPVKRSNPLTADGQAEDRRVEITSSMPEILDVLVTGDTTRTSDPPVVRFMPTVTSPRGIAAWEMTVSQRGIVLKRFTGSGALPENLDWDIADDQEHAPRFSEPLVIALNATNPVGEKVTCSMDLPTQVLTVQQKRENRAGDFTLDRYNLILFNVGESTISPANQRIVDLVRSRLTQKSVLTIEGFADRTGNPASNQRLSAARAKVTATALGRPDATVRGIGETRLLYTNDIPEGRFYCRTVQILVKTPVAGR